MVSSKCQLSVVKKIYNIYGVCKTIIVIKYLNLYAVLNKTSLYLQQIKNIAV